MYQIPVFAAERADGIESLVRASTSVAYASLARLTSPFDVAVTPLMKRARGSVKDFDLHYLKTILVSTGCNRNADVFEPVETWMARATPEHKPFNYEHDCSKIIGHIVSNHVINDASEVVADDTVVDELPAKFHVVTSAVLYKYWDQPDLQERMDLILAEIQENKWYVSMEALFKGFDYAIFEDDKTKVVARNDKTAFLTKHLRQYGGDGFYQGQKIGRLLRNIVFSGKGLVREPANPNSIIFPDPESTTEKSHVSAKQVYSLPVPATKEMTVELETLQKQLDAANAEIVALKAADVKKVQADLDLLTAAKTKSDELLKAASEQMAKVQAELKAKTEDAIAMATKFAESEKNRNEVADELKKIYAEQKTQARVSKVQETLKIDATAAKVFADALVTLTDEQFDAHIAAMAALPPKETLAPLPPKETPAKPQPQSTSKANTTPTNLDEVVIDKTEAALSVSTDMPSDGVSDVQKAIATHFGWKAE